ncbi:MAG: MarR family transcriptional regulator [Rubellimicrobium sp.]|nr:MarR family transcriptional regulator [Rubellimicrobium sp.]
MDQVTNLLGALALAVTDAQFQEMEAVSGLRASAAAAVVTIGETPRLSIAELAAIVGLTHSATVRLVDDLGRRGLVLREPANDRRSVRVGLTAQGEAIRTRLMAARATVLGRAIGGLAGPEREAFARGVAGILERLTTSRAIADHMCRLCDEKACGGEDCPVERRAIALS